MKQASNRADGIRFDSRRAILAASDVLQGEVAALRAQLVRVSNALAALNGQPIEAAALGPVEARVRALAAKPAKRRKGWTLAARKAQSKRIKAVLAAKRKAAGKGAK